MGAHLRRKHVGADAAEEEHRGQVSRHLEEPARKKQATMDNYMGKKTLTPQQFIPLTNSILNMLNGYGGLSEYELKRLENIKQNQAFLSSINLLQATEDLKRSTRRKCSQKGLRSQPSVKEVLPVRKSQRLQNKAAEVWTLPPEPRGTLVFEESHRDKKPAGPLLMDAINMEEDFSLPSELLELCSEDTKERTTKLSLNKYSSALKKMTITANSVAKVVKDRIFSAAFHPCSSSLLLAAGDKLGKVGLWNLGADWGDDGVLLFEPHTRPVGCMAFSTVHPSQLLILSYDGSLRCMDVEKAVFDDNGYGGLSEYELKRLENIKQNQAFLSSINLLQATEDLKRSTRRKCSQKGLRSQPSVKEVLPVRKSQRLQNKAAEVWTLPPEPRGTLVFEESHRDKKPAGPLLMDAINMEEDFSLPSELLELCSEDTKERTTKLSLNKYSSALKKMTITANSVAKVVKDRIFSAAFHPCSSSLLLAAGDKLGKVGLWNLGADWGDDGVLLFEPHTRPVGCMAFSTVHPSQLLILSYDGSLRCMDVEKAVFDDNGYGGLSEYELKRLENIKQNQAFLSSINLLQATEDLKRSTRRKCSQKGLRSQPSVKEVLPVRKSQRLQNKAAEVWTLPPEPRGTLVFEESHRDKKPAGPLLMDAINMEEDFSLPSELLELCSEDTKERTTKLSLNKYSSALKKMTITANSVAKVVKDRIFSAAFHPCSSSLLLAAGDKLGKVGLWNLGADWGDDGVLLFEPHTRPVGCMAFSTVHPSQLLTLSYDGSLRCMDVEKAVFDDVYNISDGLKTFAFLSHDCSTLVVGNWFGEVAIVDRRTPGNSHESIHPIDPKTLRCVSVHPLQMQYFAVAESRVVGIYDSRRLKKTKSEPVSQLTGHTLSITSAYFSPSTGNRVLTTCMDNYIRIYDTSLVSSNAPLLKSVRHDMQTGRWLSKLSAVWDPKQEDCFVVGSMMRPRRVQVFHESGKHLHTFTDEENLNTVLSVTALHPTRNALLGGNASGRVHVFS
ncbi:uncharacterized protein [Nothobranchius furzeri]|uniref:uncharacterized protein isoform X2 n=1 Tax=Nothobranchius furzeri TaxID=105023 RepID=UPI003904830C